MKTWTLLVVPFFSDGTVILLGQHIYARNEYRYADAACRSNIHSWQLPTPLVNMNEDPLTELKREFTTLTGFIGQVMLSCFGVLISFRNGHL
jgi:hypothetical protein